MHRDSPTVLSIVRGGALEVLEYSHGRDGFGKCRFYGRGDGEDHQGGASGGGVHRGGKGGVLAPAAQGGGDGFRMWLNSGVDLRHRAGDG